MPSAETLWGLGRALSVAVELASKRSVVTTPLAGLDLLYFTVQIPGGVPVGVM